MSKKFTYYGSFASIAYLTDLFGIPALPISVRKLSPNSLYSGPCLRVRRSSDNTELDINFASSSPNALLDTAALATFVGVNSAFVVKWYFQDGSGLFLEQTNTSNQPRIVNAGTLDTLNGVVGVKFDGSNDYMTGGNILSIGLGNNMQSHAIGSMSNNNGFYGKIVATAALNRYSLVVDSGQTLSFIQDNQGTLLAQPAAVNSLYTGQRIYNQEFIRNTSNKLFVNNTQVANWGGLIQEVNTRSTRFLLGALSNSNDTAEIYHLNGYVQELAIYIQPTLPNLNNININQDDFFNVL